VQRSTRCRLVYTLRGDKTAMVVVHRWWWTVSMCAGRLIVKLRPGVAVDGATSSTSGSTVRLQSRLYPVGPNIFGIE
jgi:hypothetical protein